MPKIKRSYSTFLLIFIVLTLFFTRFYNLAWGLPYPFHPDERNMVTAIQQLNCPNIGDFKNCLNPHFFAYGQLPLNLGYMIARLFHLFDGDLSTSISFSEGALALRLLSAFFSVFTVWIGYKILKTFSIAKKTRQFYWTLLLFVFSPVLIQFSHFGTTEAILMFFYTTIIYLSLLFSKEKISERLFLYGTASVLGLSIATKISSAIFLVAPLYVYLSIDYKENLIRKMFGVAALISVSILVGIIFSPHSLLSFDDFISAIRYEASVANGMEVFYTRSFFNTIPVFYQFKHVFPYALGIPILSIFIIAFFMLPWKGKYDLLRLSLLVYFIPTAFLYAKWTRFMAPIFPLMLIISSLYLLQIDVRAWIRRLIFYLLIFCSILPGIAFMSVYTKPDVRIEASKWIAKNIPTGSYLLSETANVVDIPTPLESENKKYILNSFDFYHLDEDKYLNTSLKRAVVRADYIFIPSRRIYKNHTCLNPNNIESTIGKHCKKLLTDYPVVNQYYENLFSGKLGFIKQAEFSSYPSISIFGKTWKFDDENAEETWTVFDHPVIRIYKRSE